MNLWRRPACLVLAALLGIWVLYLFLTEATIQVTETFDARDERGAQEQTVTLSCASLLGFSDGDAGNDDWMVEDDGSETMYGDLEPAATFACGGKRSARAAWVGMGSAATLGFVVAAGRPRTRKP